jgi:ribosome production factor 1
MQNPEFQGRTVCTFHNQRDFIFFRQHRYIFEGSEESKPKEKKSTSVRLQELGPRFTLKMKWLLTGPFDVRGGEYEWYHKRHEMETSRRKFNM